MPEPACITTACRYRTNRQRSSRPRDEASSKEEISQTKDVRHPRALQGQHRVVQHYRKDLHREQILFAYRKVERKIKKKQENLNKKKNLEIKKGPQAMRISYTRLSYQLLRTRTIDDMNLLSNCTTFQTERATQATPQHCVRSPVVAPASPSL